MPYTPTVWVNESTPLDALNMNNIEQGLDDVTTSADSNDARLDVLEAAPDIPSPVVNGQWLKGAAGALIYAGITIADVASLQAALDAKLDDAQLGAASGVASLDGTVRLTATQLTLHGHPISDITGLQTELDAKIDETRLGAPSGAASLDATGKVPASELPPATAIDYGTTLPAAPTNGQLAILVDSTTAPTYQWTFRYNAFSVGAYKWEFIGGSPAFSEVLTQQNVTLTSYQDLNGPSITVPRAGNYIVEIGGFLAPDSATGDMYQSYQVGATGALDADAARAGAPAAGEVKQTVARARQKTLLTAGLVIEERARLSSAGSRAISNRWLRVTPQEVS